MNQLIDIVFKTHKSYQLLSTCQLLFTSTSLYCQLLTYVIEFKMSLSSRAVLQNLRTWIFWSFAWSRPSTGIQRCKDIALDGYLIQDELQWSVIEVWFRMKPINSLPSTSRLCPAWRRRRMMNSIRRWPASWPSHLIDLFWKTNKWKWFWVSTCA